MKRQPIKHQLDGLIALLLFGVFAVCVLSVLLTGAQAYRRLTQRDQNTYSRRTCTQYMAARIRQADCLDGVAVEDFGGTPALVLAGAPGTEEYITRVYYYDGWIMELYADRTAPLEPADGEQIMRSDGMELSLTEDGLLTIRVSDASGAENTLTLALRSGREGAAA